MNDLTGQLIVFTGKMATMTRSEAANLVSDRRGTVATKVTRSTTMLVVGQEGWPLKKDGSISDKLRAARELREDGHGIAIFTEEEFLDRLGIYGDAGGVRQRFTADQLGRMLQVPRDQLRSWIRAGLVEPIETVQGVAFFDFNQVTGMRTILDLSHAGVGIDKIRESMEQLSAWLPRLRVSLNQLNVLEKDGQLFVRLEDGQLADSTGQMHLDFDSDDEPDVAFSGSSVAAPDYLERSGQLEEAARAYRALLLEYGPSVRLCYNLGNVLFAMGQYGPAAERFRQTIELDHTDHQAWNNLGNTLMELGQMDEALEAFERALQIDPAYSDAHFNLADALEQVGRFSEARRHWKELVRLEPVGDWAEYARERLAPARYG